MIKFGEVSERISACVATVRRRAVDHRQEFAANETATRVQLIDPMLSALGWDVENPLLVKHEYKIGSGRLDYALFFAGELAAIVEAKSLSTSFQALPQAQLMKYARDPECNNLRAVAVTNGIEWVVHRESNQWTLERIDLSESETYKVAYELFEILHRSHFAGDTTSATDISGRKRGAKRRSSVPPAVAQRPRPARAASRFPPPPKGRAMLDLSDAKFKAARDAPPRLVVDHRGDAHETKHWIDLLVVVANALIEDNLITKAACPIKTAEDRQNHLINTVPFHTNGRRFQNPKKVSRGFFLEAGLPAMDSYNYARDLLQLTGIPLAEVQFSVEPT